MLILLKIDWLIESDNDGNGVGHPRHAPRHGEVEKDVSFLFTSPLLCHTLSVTITMIGRKNCGETHFVAISFLHNLFL